MEEADAAVSYGNGGRSGYGMTNKVRAGDNHEALDRESAGHAGRHMLRGGNGAGI